jgi:hypothetical protein
MEHASILEKKQGFCCAPIIEGLRSFSAIKWKGGGIGEFDGQSATGHGGGDEVA